jgi:hypothetical protein
VRRFLYPGLLPGFSFDAPNTVLDTSSQLPPSPRTNARFALPDLTIGQSYIYRAVLATGLAILTAVLMRPTATILKPRPNESIAQPAVLTSSSRLELRGNRVESEQRVDGKSAPTLPSPAGTTRPKPLRSLPQQFAASGRLRRDKPAAAKALSRRAPNLDPSHRATSAPSTTKFNPPKESGTERKFTYVWR